MQRRAFSPVVLQKKSEKEKMKALRLQVVLGLAIEMNCSINLLIYKIYVIKAYLLNYI